MPKTVETYRTTKALRDLVRKAARLGQELDRHQPCRWH